MFTPDVAVPAVNVPVTVLPPQFKVAEAAVAFTGMLAAQFADPGKVRSKLAVPGPEGVPEITYTALPVAEAVPACKVANKPITPVEGIAVPAG